MKSLSDSLQRKFIFISSGILFICISIALIVIGSSEHDNMMIMLFGMSIPFLFTGFWNIYSVLYERKVNYSNEYFTWRKSFSFGAGAFYNSKIVVPVFIVMFGTVVFAIVNAFLASNKSTEDFAIAVVPLSFVYGLLFTIYFLVKINREVSAVRSVDLTEQDANNPGISTEDIGFKVAFFFATVATLGLFALGWWVYKKLKPNSQSHPDEG